jgi:DNA-binding LacI/PurR family transcriptional regulator
MTTPRTVTTPHTFGLQRRERIMDELRRDGSVRVSRLAAEIGVSEITVRRDINALADEGLVTRVHGGATLRSTLDVGTSSTSRSRGTGTTRFTIGMVVPSLSFYWPQVVHGARAAATLGRDRVVVRGSSYSVRDDRSNIRRLLDSGEVDGLLLAPQVEGEEGRDLVRWLDTLDVPVVLVERQPPAGVHTQRVEWVRTDHAYGAGLAVRHLHGQGHRRVGLVTATSPHADLIRAGWREACDELGMPSGDDLVGRAVGFGDEAWEQVLDERMAQVQQTGTTALLVHSDPEAIALLQLCADRGIRVPGDLAVVAYDDEVASMAEPALTAVRPPKSEVGRAAVELLTARLGEGRRRPRRTVSLDPWLVVRASSRSGRAGHPEMSP